jgi:hypothetical protein
VFGQYKEGCQWFAFTTGPQEGADYWITGVNGTADSTTLYGHLFEADGTLLQPVRINYTRAEGNNISAGSVLQGNESGRAATGSVDALAPDTT